MILFIYWIFLEFIPKLLNMFNFFLTLYEKYPVFIILKKTLRLFFLRNPIRNFTFS